MHGFDAEDLNFSAAVGVPQDRLAPEMEARVLKFLDSFEEAATQEELQKLLNRQVGGDARRAMGPDYWEFTRNERLRPPYHNVLAMCITVDSDRLKINKSALKLAK